MIYALFIVVALLSAVHFLIMRTVSSYSNYGSVARDEWTRFEAGKSPKTYHF